MALPEVDESILPADAVICNPPTLPCPESYLHILVRLSRRALSCEPPPRDGSLANAPFAHRQQRL